MDEAYAQLPKNLQDLLDSKETAATINNIGKKYALHIDQLGQLAIVVRAILSGLVSRQNSLSQLREETGLPEDTINLIVYDLNQQIFSKIREELEKETLPTQNTSSKQIFEEKMSGVANVPKQEVEVKTQTGDNDTKDATVKPPRDPYREPIN